MEEHSNHEIKNKMKWKHLSVQLMNEIAEEYKKSNKILSSFSVLFHSFLFFPALLWYVFAFNIKISALMRLNISAEDKRKVCWILKWFSFFLLNLILEKLNDVQNINVCSVQCTYISHIIEFLRRQCHLPKWCH